MPKKPFIFNDESVKNSYGFMIPTAGIGLSRFKKNPMMLNTHYNSTSAVLGKWESVKKSNGLLTGVPVFDSADEDAAKIEGKVDRGFISTCSMGVSFKREDLKIVGGVLLLTKCELYEVSIVAIPSNANSIRLYVDDADTPLSDDEVTELCLSVSEIITEIKPKDNLNMEKITLVAAAMIALGYKETDKVDVAELSAKVIELQAQKTAADLKLSAFQTEKEAATLAAINLQVDTAIKEGRTTADKKADFVNLGIANPNLLTSTLAALPVKKSLGAQVTDAGETEVKTADDFQKLSLEAQLEFKATSPEKYQELFTIKK